MSFEQKLKFHLHFISKRFEEENTGFVNNLMCSFIH